MARRKTKEMGERFPHLLSTPPPRYYKRMKPAEEHPAALARPLEKRDSQEVLRGFKMLANGWGSGVESALRLPPELFYSRGVGARFYSSCESSDLGGLLLGLGAGKLILPDTDYGIVLYETSSSVYFMLFDAKRRICVREPLMCFDSTPMEREWPKIRKSIDEATALAASDDAKKNGLFAVYDGTLRLATVENGAPPVRGAPQEVA
ncbi:hypothetical protein L0Y65_05655 [Candidatus Micrarchaeota archaeon]|nr:hypothetical protein [Candidatus Micrarchaeota archaeon]